MRVGYAGRGVTYAAVAGLSLWAIWRGGEAQGTSSALEHLSGSGWGIAVLWLIGIGLLAYAIWRGINATEDLEEYGAEPKGMVARAGMIVTGLIHAVIGAVAISLALGGGGSGGEGGGLSDIVGRILEMPAGRWMVAFAATCTIGSGIYYAIKAWNGKYRETLMANHFTRNWDWALKAGVLAQGIVITIVGGFLAVAAWQGNESEAGGMGKAFDWLASQPFGNVLVVAVCLGLAGFAFFCFVNAAYRIVPRIAGADLTSLASKLKAKAA